MPVFLYSYGVQSSSLHGKSEENQSTLREKLFARLCSMDNNCARRFGMSPSTWKVISSQGTVG